MQAIVNSSQTKAPTRNAARGGLTGALRVSHRRARDRPTARPTATPNRPWVPRGLPADDGTWGRNEGSLQEAGRLRWSPGLRTTPSGWTKPPRAVPRPEPLPAGCPCPLLLHRGQLSSTTLPLQSSPREPAASVGPLHPISPWRLLPGRPRLSRTPVGIRKRSRVPGGIAAISGFLQDEQPSGEPCLA